MESSTSAENLIRVLMKLLQRTEMNDSEDQSDLCSIRNAKTFVEIREMQDEIDLNACTLEEKLAIYEWLRGVNSKNTCERETHILDDDQKAKFLYILLKFALQSRNRPLLQICFSVNEEKVITMSIACLIPSEALLLLKTFIPMIKLRGAVLSRALPWLKYLLFQHASIIAAYEPLLLESLNQAIEERTSNYKEMVELYAIMDCMLPEVPEDENAAPAVIHTDTGSDDGEVSSYVTESDDEEVSSHATESDD